ncbi:DUF6934 family protein [Flavobacterium cerinum]|uniref:Uncharacterized protein n=1 Tax=Flavobacterium cerinum TaxID=2502784 RepID=A0A444HB09_9FLAO|nr:hypothetical protein [Flavobacterium cerinum]RWX00511.1 hypothetical protein EPI11_09560 [Flavobacterium cerinum]
MTHAKYELSANPDFTVFEFTSTGKNGPIQKAIKYTQTLNKDVYNLGFGDIISSNETTGEVEIDDIGISNNGDLQQILTTVAYSAYAFTERYPKALILFGSSDKAKIRLYRIMLSHNLAEISKTFILFGAVHNKQGQLINIPFDPNQDVEGYFVRRK